MRLPAIFYSAVLLGLYVAGCAHDVASDRVVFRAESAEFDAAATEYRQIWADDGARIIAAMEGATGLRLERGPIVAIVHEGISFSGYGDVPMRLRASYPPDTKRATLVHELSHRLTQGVTPDDVEDHPIIFLFLYDVWVDLWGQAFADAQVAVESRRRGRFNYKTGWQDALALSAEERARRWQQYRLEHVGR